MIHIKETKESGITLIALIVTIIVLLILAGVSISLVLGNNGVLTQATGAVTANKEATAKEDVKLAWTGAVAQYWEEWVNDSSKQKNLEFFRGKLQGKQTDIGQILEIKYNNDDTYTVKYKLNEEVKPYIFIIYENGNVERKGEGNAPVIAKDSSNIGKSVNYGVEYVGGGSGWQILYADDDNVYIMPKGYLTAGTFPITQYQGAQDFENLDETKYPAIAAGWLNKLYGKNFTNDAPSMKAVSFLLDSSNSKWSSLKNDFADWVIGAPTMELIVESYNTVNPDNKLTVGDVNENGYYPKLHESDNGLIHMPNDGINPWNNGENYWIAAPRDQEGVYYVWGYATMNRWLV